MVMALSINDIVERIKYKEVEFLGKKLEKD